MMRLSSILMAALLVAVFALSCAAPDSEPVRSEHLVEAWLPSGDAAAGRNAFIALRCQACHEVKGDPDVPMLTAVDAGPALGPELALMSQGELVSAIVVPSHSVVHVGATSSGGELSRMGDFTEVMTVRQLMDIVSYLEQIARP